MQELQLWEAMATDDSPVGSSLRLCLNKPILYWIHQNLGLQATSYGEWTMKHGGKVWSMVDVE
jgi:hypothetical protein